MVSALLNRIPSRAQIASVYSIIVLIFYTWTVLWLLWKYPSWLFFLTLDEIVLAFAYSLMNCFFESLTIILGLILFAVILPQKWFYEAFVARAVAFLLPICGYMMYIAYQFTGKLAYPSAALRWAPLVFVAALVLVFFAGKLGFLKKTLEVLAERATVFIYVSLPLSILSVVVVVAVFLYQAVQ